MNLEGGGCSELRSHHCTLAWGDRARLCQKKKKRARVRERGKKDEHVEKQESGHALGSWKFTRGRAAWGSWDKVPTFQEAKEQTAENEEQPER